MCFICCWIHWPSHTFKKTFSLLEKSKIIFITKKNIKKFIFTGIITSQILYSIITHGLHGILFHYMLKSIYSLFFYSQIQVKNLRKWYSFLIKRINVWRFSAKDALFLFFYFSCLQLLYRTRKGYTFFILKAYINQQCTFWRTTYLTKSSVFLDFY